MLFIPWFEVGPWSVPSPFESPQLWIHVYGLMIWIGVAAGLIAAAWFARTHDRSLRLTFSLGVYLIVFSFPISAFLNALFYHPSEFLEVLRTPSKLPSFRFGLSSYGGVAGAVTGGLVWRWRRGESLLRAGDAAAFAGPFGWFFGRVGCFLSHDHPGRRTGFFLAVADYPVGTQPFSARHDLGLYEALVFLGIVGLFVFLSRKPRSDGFYVAMFPLLYTPIRFMLDFLRASPSDGGDVRYYGLTPGQYASIALFFAAAALMVQIRARERGKAHIQ